MKRGYMEVEITDGDYVGMAEIYEPFFRCPNCGNDNIVQNHKFCPDCGSSLKIKLEKHKMNS